MLTRWPSLIEKVSWFSNLVTEEFWVYAAHLAFVVTVVYIVVILAIHERIEMTIEVLKVTSKTLVRCILSRWFIGL